MGQVIQIDGEEIQNYLKQINFLQKNLLPQITKLLEVSDAKLNSRISKDTLLDQNKLILQTLESSKENSKKSTNINLLLTQIAKGIENKETLNDDNDIDSKIELERSKLQLSNTVKELETLSTKISSNLEEIRSIKPNINIDEIQKNLNIIMKKSINYKKVEESIDQYVGKISYFDEKIKEYQGSAEIFNKATKNINYYGMILTFFVGTSVGVLFTRIIFDSRFIG